MPQITTYDGMTFEYETTGSPGDPPVLMIMGFATQLVGWPRDFCELLAQRGRFVISFDNRDCGLSAKLEGHDARLDEVMTAAAGGDFEAARALAPYTLSDMADDGFGLLGALGIERAHIVGTSMGGMIAQTMAIEHPERVITLTSMMSTTGEPEFGQSTPAALEALLAPTPADRAGYIASADTWLVWHSKRYPDLDETRAIAAASGGRRTAALVPNAKLLLIEDMGHDRPRALRPRISQAILDHTAVECAESLGSSSSRASK
jgi:pimeloyl-ACP methyl ester carboxylesterase